MNKILRNVLIIAAILAVGAFIASKLIRKNAGQLSPQATVQFEKKGLSIKIVYCRPSKKGRLIFGQEKDMALQPFGKYWRLGANEATTFETNKNLSIEGHSLPAGKYSMYAVPGIELWQFGINKIADRWGAAEPDYNEDLFKIEVPVNYTEQTIEQFTISVEGDGIHNKLIIWWDTSKTVIPFEVVN